MDNPNITMEEYIRLEEEKARRRGKVYNWKTAKCGKIWYDEDVHDLRFVETEFPAIVLNDELSSEKNTLLRTRAIVYNDALTSKSDHLTEPTLRPQHIDEFDLKDETSLSEYDEVEQNSSGGNPHVTPNGVFGNEVYGSDSEGFGMNPSSNKFRLCNSDEWMSENHGGRVIIHGYDGGGDMVVRHGLKGYLDHRIIRSSPILPPLL
ncbi:hypothetical protein Tco_0268550 [Tanacetum coccineum]